MANKCGFQLFSWVFSIELFNSFKLQGVHWWIRRNVGESRNNYSSTWSINVFLPALIPHAGFKLYNSSTDLTHFLMAPHTPAHTHTTHTLAEGSQRSVRNEETANRRRQEEKWYCNWQSLSGINHMHKFNLRTHFEATPTRSFSCCRSPPLPSTFFLLLFLSLPQSVVSSSHCCHPIGKFFIN